MSRNPIQYFIVIILFAIITSCKNESGTNKIIVSRSPELIDTTGECQQETHSQVEKDESLKVIDFFGVKMQGKYEDIVNNIYSLPVLSLVERRDTIMLQGNGDKWFSHTVDFCGVSWGMSAEFTINKDNIMSIHHLTFITSKTDDDIIDKVVGELTKYYGEPDISDEQEDSYHWYLQDNLYVRARHLHAPDGGWTVYIWRK